MADPIRIVIVGGVAAGPKAAARARRLDPSADITIVEKDEILSYAGCGLPYYISGVVEHRKSLLATGMGVVRDAQFFGQMKAVKVLNRTEATGIDRAAKELEVKCLATGEVQRLPYDKLIIATGADPVVPPIPGADLEGVVRLKLVEDADAFRELVEAEACSSVVIVGGGLIGVEMAEAVVECGRAVTVVEMLPQILTVFDVEVAALVENQLRAKGAAVMTSTRVLRLEGDEGGRVARVVTDKGEVPAQLVLLSIGIRPNVRLAQEAGLLIGPSGGIHVDEYMQTSDPSIYAAGDCTEKRHLVLGKESLLPLGSVANKEGRVAGSNAVGYTDRFPGVLGATALKVFDWNVARAGVTDRQAADQGIETVSMTVAGPDTPQYYPGALLVILKLTAEAGTRKLLGIQAVGPGDTVKRVDVAATAMTAGMTVDEVANLDLCYAPPYSEALDVLITGANALRNKLDGVMRGVNAAALQANREAGEDVFLLDVRTPAEHVESRIPGSVLIPLGALRERADEVPTDRRVVLYCKSSLRAYEASRMLVGKGLTNVEVLEGGIVAWPYDKEADGS